MQQKVTQPQMVRISRLWGGNVGMLFILLGSLFLWVKLSGTGDNWWSVFILSPALAFWGLAASQYRNGRSHLLVRVNAALGLIVSTVALMFLFNLNWGTWWPLMIVTPGLGLLWVSLPSVMESPTGHVLASMGRWLSMAMLVLGLIFQLNQTGVINLTEIFGTFQWWGFCILLPSFGAFSNAVYLYRQHESSFLLNGLLVLGVWTGGIAVQELAGITWDAWEGIIGVALVASGAALLMGGLRTDHS